MNSKITNGLFVFLLLSALLQACKETQPNNTVQMPADSTHGDEKLRVLLPRLDTLQYETGNLMSGSLTTVCESVDLMADSLLTKSQNIKLEIGDKVYILFELAPVSLRNWLMPVYKVVVEKEGKELEGYLGLESLVINKKQLLDGNLLLVSLQVPQRSDFSKMYVEFLVTDKAFNVLGHAKSEIDFTPNFPEHGQPDEFMFSQETETRIRPGAGMRQVNSIIESYMYFRACGYLSGTNYLIWDGHSLNKLFSTTGMYEAGLFSNYSGTIFPAKENNSKSDTIIQYSVHIEYPEDEESNTLKVYDSTVVAYYWNGTLSKPDTLQTYHLK